MIKIANSKKSRRKKVNKQKRKKLRRQMRHLEQQEVDGMFEGFFDKHLGIPEEWLDSNKSEPAGTKYRTYYSKIIDSEVSYLIYLPPNYENSNCRYPVVYWLHGLDGNQRKGAKFVEKLDIAVKLGNAPPMIAVLVNGLSNSMYCDLLDDSRPVERVIVNELIPHVDEMYHTIAQREARAVEGFSMGGFGAAHLGFKYPELFGAVSIMSGSLHDADSMAQIGQDIFQDVFSENREYFQANSPWTLAEKNADAIRGEIAVRIIVGSEDDIFQRNKAYHEFLSHLEIPHQFDVIEGVGHNANMLYEKLGDMAFSFYSKIFAPILGYSASDGIKVQRESSLY